MGPFKFWLFVFVVVIEFISFGHGVDVFQLHPKYTDEDDNKASFLVRDSERIGRSILADRSALFQLKGNVIPDGLYYVSIVLGNPPTQFFLDVDSGSDLTWVQCDAPCTSCAKGPHALYKPRRAALVPKRDPLCVALQTNSAPRDRQYKASTQQCDYEVDYVDRGSSYGVLLRDFVRLTLSNRTVLRTTAAFGCAYDQRGSLAKSPAPTDGILGLGGGAVSLPSQWAKQGLIKNMIGHCISGGGRDGGYMFFGHDLVPSSMSWVPLIGGPATKNYYVGAAQMSMGNRALDKGGDSRMLGGIIFDSGSSFTYFTNRAYSAFISTLKEYLHGKPLSQDSSDKTLPICWRGKKRFKSVTDAAAYFKPLVLSFGSTSIFSSRKQFEISPEGYLVISKKGNACLGILDGTELKIGNKNILGDISLQGYLVVYDNENNRIGWTRADCRRIPNVTKQRRVLHSTDPNDSSVGEFSALEDVTEPDENTLEETRSCVSELRKATCPSSVSNFLPAHDAYPQNSYFGSA